MNKLATAKKIIKDNFEEGRFGLFNTRNLVGDPMTIIFDREGLRIEICYYYEYFEVFGLSKEDFEELKEYYKKLRKDW